MQCEKSLAKPMLSMLRDRERFFEGVDDAGGELTADEGIRRIPEAEDPVVVHFKNTARDPSVVLVVFPPKKIRHPEVIDHELHYFGRHL